MTELNRMNRLDKKDYIATELKGSKRIPASSLRTSVL